MINKNDISKIKEFIELLEIVDELKNSYTKFEIKIIRKIIILVDKKLLVKDEAMNLIINLSICDNRGSVYNKTTELLLDNVSQEIISKINKLYEK